ncbi:hypothetical protein AALA22_12975 [Anaerovoracaceae bacterium 41-7]
MRSKWKVNSYDWHYNAVYLEYDCWHDVFTEGIKFFDLLRRKEIVMLFIKEKPIKTIAAFIAVMCIESARCILYYLCLPFVLLSSYIVNWR